MKQLTDAQLSVLLDGFNAFAREMENNMESLSRAIVDACVAIDGIKQALSRLEGSARESALQMGDDAE